MKYIKLLYGLIVFSLLISLQAGAQVDYHSKTLILKLDAQHAEYAGNASIQHPEVNDFMNTLEYTSIERLFPRHSTPDQTTDRYGNPLVDISMIYQVKYKADVKEEIAAQKLEQIGIFEYVCLRPMSYPLGVPNDSLINQQYHHGLIKAYQAWDIVTGDSTVVVGITDSGIDRLQEDLQNIAYNTNDTIDGIDNDNDGYVDNYFGWDMADNDREPQWVVNPHGVFVTGLSSAEANNGRGIAGTSYNAPYLPIKVVDSTGAFTRDYEGIVYAADHGCKVVNCSWGGFRGSPFGQDIVNYATFNKNVLVVAAAGNSYSDVWVYPASYDNVLSIAASNHLDLRWAHSSFGTTVDLMAPGESVFSCWSNYFYQANFGTSLSAPIVSGAAALVIKHFPQFTALQVGEQIRVSCDVIDTIPGNDTLQGYLGAGRLNMFKALTDTVSPSVRLRNTQVQYTGSNIYIRSEFFNYLRSTSATAYAVLRTTSPYLTILDSIVDLPNLASMSATDNFGSPLHLTVGSNTPYNYQHDVAIHFIDTAYHGLEFIRLNINNAYWDLDTNNIRTTVTSTSRLAYTNNAKTQGSGFRYKNGDFLFDHSGLVMGTSMNQVSDAIYNDAGGFDTDFIPFQAGHYVDPADLGHQQINAIFRDAGAANAMQVIVKQRAYAYDSLEQNNYILLDYIIKNEGFMPLNKFYVGYYIDWDIETSSKNRAEYDSSLHLAYTYPTLGGVYGGIQALSGYHPHCYQITNDGSDSTINIYDGFATFEKYQALSNRKDSAGFNTVHGKDVSTLVSYGPYNVQVGDSVHVVFAVLAGDHLTDIKNSAQEAYDTYYWVDDTGIEEEEDISGMELFPNPATSNMQVKLDVKKAQELVIRIYDSNGKQLGEARSLKVKTGQNTFTVQVEGLAQGVYNLSIQTNEKQISKRFVVVKP